MRIRKATNKDKEKAIQIAKELKEWFNKTAIKNMKIDFKVNNLVVALEKGKVVGFLCYNSYEGFLKIVWIGVKKEYHRKGVGTKLLNWLEKEAKKLKVEAIEVETLTDRENYEPYEATRNFYYKHGFKKLYELKPRKKDWDVQILLEKKIEDE